MVESSRHRAKSLELERLLGHYCEHSVLGKLSEAAEPARRRQALVWAAEVCMQLVRPMN